MPLVTTRCWLLSLSLPPAGFCFHLTPHRARPDPFASQFLPTPPVTAWWHTIKVNEITIWPRNILRIRLTDLNSHISAVFVLSQRQAVPGTSFRPAVRDHLFKM